MNNCEGLQDSSCSTITLVNVQRSMANVICSSSNSLVRTFYNVYNEN